MALLQSFNLEHLPSTHTVHVALFHDVSNAETLQKELLAGNTDFEYAFIDASVIVSTTHALAAAFRAVNDLVEDRLKSRNVHSEIVFSLSPNNNIAESFRRFGITPTTTTLLVIKVTTPSTPSLTAETIQAHLSSAVQGTQVAFADDVLAATTDVARVKKLYKLNSGGGGGGGKKNAKGGRGDKASPGQNGATNGAVTSSAVAVADEQKVDEKTELEVAVLGAMALRGIA